ncbi:MAG: KamA family radical SAM protein [Candidatus Izemoplasmatales bacterium]
MKREMKHQVITKLEEIKGYELLSEEEKNKYENIFSRHPMKIPKYYYDLIDFSDQDDPIRKLAIPSFEELNNIGEVDTSGEASNTKLPGVQHKYPSTVLVLSTNVCFMYCRHCFRKRMVGYSNEEITKRMEVTISYVKDHSEINNVLISGGDAFTLSNEIIESYLKNLSKISHLDFIRFGTRSLVVYPQRIYQDHRLLGILKKYNKVKEIIIVTHFNHAKEITEEAVLAIKALKEIGISVINQTVLLKGINDHSEVLAELLSKLTKVGIHPYYVFQCRPVKGATHFQVSLSQGMDIINGARERLNGIAKGFRYIMAHRKGKIEIVGKTETDFIFKFHQNKYPEDSNRIFIRTASLTACWLNDDLELIDIT